MSTEERVLRLEKAFTNLEELAAKSDERTSDLEEHFKMLTQLAVSASERADTHESWINSLGTPMEKLGTRMEEVGTRMEEVAEAQKQTTAHLSVLTEIMGDLGRAHTSLTKRFEEYISSRP